MFAYFKEFTCRISDIAKVVPKPDGGAYLYIINPSRDSTTGVSRETTNTAYEKVIAQLAAAMSQSHAAYVNTEE